LALLFFHEKGSTTMNALPRKILVAIDFSEPSAAALIRAVSLAEKNNAEITLLHVLTHIGDAVEGTSFEGHWRMPPAELRRAEERLRQEADDRLEAWMRPHVQANLLRKQIVDGAPFVEIIRAVLREQYDLVVAGTRGLSPVSRFLVGSTAERLVRKCPCPVWIVGTEHDGPLHSILVPVDFSDTSALCLQTASVLGQAFGSVINALHVLYLPRVNGLVLPEAADVDLRRYRREARRAAAKFLDNFVASHTLAGVSVKQHLAVGNPWKMIDSAAKRTAADVIVMGTVGRGGIAGLLIGNTAEKVLRVSGRSLLAVKPEGFVSPVRLD
jgi:nucleotide-binding universal stress UspA family protein